MVTAKELVSELGTDKLANQATVEHLQTNETLLVTSKTAAFNNIGTDVTMSLEDSTKLDNLATAGPELERKVRGLERSGQVLQSELDAANRENKSLADEFRAAHKRHQEQQKAAEQNIDNLEEDKRQLGTDLLDIQQKFSRLEETVKTCSRKLDTERQDARNARSQLQKAEEDKKKAVEACAMAVERNELVLAQLNLLLFDVAYADNTHDKALREFMETLVVLRKKALETNTRFGLDDDNMLEGDGVVSVARASTAWSLSFRSFKQVAPYLRLIFRLLTVVHLRPQDDEVLTMLEALSSQVVLFKNQHIYLLHDALEHMLDDDQVTSERISIIEAKMIELVYFVCTHLFFKFDELDTFRERWLGRCVTRQGQIQCILIQAYADWFDCLVNSEQASLPDILYGLRPTGHYVNEEEGDPKRQLMSKVSATENLYAVVDTTEQQVVVFKAEDEGVNYNHVTRFVGLPIRRNKTNDFVATASFELPNVPVWFLRRNMVDVYNKDL